MTVTLPVSGIPIGVDFDPEEIRRRYAEERAKRLKHEPLEQFQGLSEALELEDVDRYAEPIDREPVREDVEGGGQVVVVGHGGGDVEGEAANPGALGFLACGLQGAAAVVAFALGFVAAGAFGPDAADLPPGDLGFHLRRGLIGRVGRLARINESPVARHTSTPTGRPTNTPPSTAPIAVATVVAPTPPATPATDSRPCRAALG